MNVVCRYINWCMAAAVVCYAVVFLNPLAAYGRDSEPENVKSAGCRTAFYLITDLAPGYEEATHKRLLPEGKGNKKATASLLDGAIDFAFTCQPHEKLAKKFEYDPDKVKHWRSRRIAKDPIVVVVNSLNPIAGLTRKQLSDIFLGRIANWSALGGPDMEIRLTYEDDPQDFSGVLNVFKENTVGEDAATVKGAVRFSEPSERGLYVSRNPGALSFMGLRAYRPEYGRMLKIDGVEPTRENIVNDSYPLAATYYIIYDTQKGAEAEAFLDYLSSERGLKAVDINFIADIR